MKLTRGTIVRGATAAVAALAILGPGTPSGAADKRATVKITIRITPHGQPNPDFVEGRVRSPRPVCAKAGRDIRLFQNGNLIDTSKLKTDGSYRLLAPSPAPGLGYVTRTNKTAKCKAGVSPTKFGDGS